MTNPSDLTMHGTTVLCVRRDGKTAMAGDGQVTLGDTIVKGGARKVHRLADGKVLAGFAGATADAFTLLERFEKRLESHHGKLSRAADDLARDWRTDRVLRRLEAMLMIANADECWFCPVWAMFWNPNRESPLSAAGRYMPKPRRAHYPKKPRFGGANRPKSDVNRRKNVHLYKRPRCRGRNRRMSDKMLSSEELTPRRIVRELDRYIVGQGAAKRAVALALRSRWRRMQIESPLREEIAPKNILMIGPTGVGKTEISRRLARLTGAPFIKVEATKFTEVGYVGRDVDSIIRDLTEMAVESYRADYAEEVRERAELLAENRVLEALLPGDTATEETRNKMLKKLRNGDLDDSEIEIEVSAMQVMEMQMPPGMEEMAAQFQQMMQTMGRDRRKKRRMSVGSALDMIIDEETDNLVDMGEVKDAAIDGVENNGIVFIDEMDKIAGDGGRDNDRDVSRHGVQRDLLPLVEGTTVSTRFGNVHTDHILFVASGAFHYTSPADLIPELQGRFPLRVELSPLGVADFEKILSGTDSCLTRQYEALLATEKVKLKFTSCGVSRLAEMAWRVNENSENIGARRLYTMLENLLEEVSFEADSMGGKTIVVDETMVNERLASVAENRGRARYVL